MKRKNKLRSILLLVFSVLFFVSAYMVYGIISQAHREQDNFEQLKEIVKQPFLAFDPSQTQEPPETDDASSPYACLLYTSTGYVLRRSAASSAPRRTKRRERSSGQERRSERAAKSNVKIKASENSEIVFRSVRLYARNRALFSSERRLSFNMIFRRFTQRHIKRQKRKAVSYTHLDVYKRQPAPSPGRISSPGTGPSR